MSRAVGCFDLATIFPPHAHHVNEIGVLAEQRREVIHIVPIPGISKGAPGICGSVDHQSHDMISVTSAKNEPDGSGIIRRCHGGGTW
jgi:hypothetical protein